MEDVRLEKCVEVIYDQTVLAVPIRKRKNCPALMKMARMLDEMKNENNKQIALDLGIVGSCDECDGSCQ